MGHFHCRVAAAVLLCLLLAVGCSGDEPVRIGYAGQLVGEYADLGVAGRNGVTLAVEDINAAGGIAGRKVALLVRDDGDTPESARQADAELLEQGAVGIIGHMTSGKSMAVLPMLRDKNIPLVSPTTSTPRLSGLEDNFFRVQVASNKSAAGLAIFAATRLQLRRVAMLADTGNQAYIESFSSSFVASFEQQGGVVTPLLPFNASASPDWESLLRQATAGNAQGLCVVAPAVASAMLVQHARRLGLELPVLASGAARTAAFLQQGGMSVEGVYLTSSINNQVPGFQEFAARYKKRFGREALFASVRGYEAAMLMAKGLERTGGSGKGLIQALQAVEAMEGVDTAIRLDRFGDSHRPWFIVQVQDGRFQNIGSIDPDAAP